VEYGVRYLEGVDEARGVKSFRFERPGGYGFLAGQYCLLRLGEGLVKPFSFSNAPGEGDYLQFTTRMSGSMYKRALGDLSVGESAMVSDARGEFTLSEGHDRVVFLAGGIGITPFRSICRDLMDKGSAVDVVLFYGGGRLEDMAFRGDFEAMSSGNPGLMVVYVPESPPEGWSGCSGRICEGHLRGEVPDFLGRQIFVCGPPGMVESMRGMLESLGVSPGRVFVEGFQGY
jgi:glycine betaine catabolism B